jgi:hypothetical protein
MYIARTPRWGPGFLLRARRFFGLSGRVDSRRSSLFDTSCEVREYQLDSGSVLSAQAVHVPAIRVAPGHRDGVRQIDVEKVAEDAEVLVSGPAESDFADVMRSRVEVHVV